MFTTDESRKIAGIAVRAMWLRHSIRFRNGLIDLINTHSSKYICSIELINSFNHHKNEVHYLRIVSFRRRCKCDSYEFKQCGI